MTKKILLVPTLLLLCISSFAQFPTSVGSKWEYYQVINCHWVNPFAAFTDTVVGTASFNGETYQEVDRYGALTTYTWDCFGGPFTDIMVGTWHYRVSGDTVFALDSVVGVQNYESVFYDFSLGIGDTLYYLPKSVVDMTWRETLYDLEYSCANWDPTPCTGNWIVDTFNGWWGESGYSFDDINEPARKYFAWEDDIGAFFTTGIDLPLGMIGYEFYLKRFSINDSTIYEQDLGGLINVDEALARIELEVYPNPARDVVMLRSSAQIDRLELLDASGRLVRSYAFDRKNEGFADLQGLVKGMYFLRVDAGESTVMRKLVVE